MVAQPQIGLVPKSSLSERDVAEIAELAATCNAYEGLDLKLTVEMRPDDPAAQTSDLLYYVDGALAGYCGIDGGDGAPIELCGMVHPAQRRRGIGRALLAAAAEEAMRRGARALLVVCEEASQSGRAFVAVAGAHHRFSEHRLYLDVDLFRSGRRAIGDVVLHSAGPDDLEALVRVLVASFGESEEETRARVMAEMADPTQPFYLARLGRETVGVIRPIATDTAAYLYAFGVLPEHRGRGLGRQILTQAIEDLLAQGYTRIGIEVETENRNALRLYLSCGFREVTVYGYYRLDLGGTPGPS